MKSLFHKKPANLIYSYTTDASSIRYEVEQAFQTILDKWAKKGYSPWEIANIVYSSIGMMVSRKILDVRDEKRARAARRAARQNA